MAIFLTYLGFTQFKLDKSHQHSIRRPKQQSDAAREDKTINAPTNALRGQGP
jgi:hypothetical protein